MLKLINLEIKKFKLWHYWKAVFICNISFIVLLSMMFFIEIDGGKIPIESFDMAASIIGALVRTTFTIFASVIIVKLIIDEFRNKSIDVLFTYPIKRKKIISAKLTIVFIFTFVNVLFSTLFLEGLVNLADVNFNILPGAIELEDISRHLLTAFMNAIATAGISIIPLFFGMQRKSSPATIVSSILIATILNSTSEDFNLFSIIAVPLSLGLFGLYIGYYSIRNIEKKDLV
ncbi:ABC transporter permease [Gottfriedia acidiceleris]|uniref:ABC transporter permease n=1 Tax=Gottfriedia acidiceleris TaxID=371036 RepID=UPI001431E6D3|nr:ABC transporter permease [Gottfriedia acidiceleris]